MLWWRDRGWRQMPWSRQSVCSASAAGQSSSGRERLQATTWSENCWGIRTRLYASSSWPSRRLVRSQRWGLFLQASVWRRNNSEPGSTLVRWQTSTKSSCAHRRHWSCGSVRHLQRELRSSTTWSLQYASLAGNCGDSTRRTVSPGRSCRIPSCCLSNKNQGWRSLFNKSVIKLPPLYPNKKTSSS